MTRQLKPCPADFPEVFRRHGWRGIEAYGCRRDVLERWIDECGRDGLKAARRAYRRELSELRKRRR